MMAGGIKRSVGGSCIAYHVKSCINALLCKNHLYPSYFKLLVRWLPLLTPVTYLSKLLGIRAIAAFTQLELFRVYNSPFFALSVADAPTGLI